MNSATQFDFWTDQFIVEEGDGHQVATVKRTTLMKRKSFETAYSVTRSDGKPICLKMTTNQVAEFVVSTRFFPIPNHPESLGVGVTTISTQPDADSDYFPWAGNPIFVKQQDASGAETPYPADLEEYPMSLIFKEDWGGYVLALPYIEPTPEDDPETGRLLVDWTEEPDSGQMGREFSIEYEISNTPALFPLKIEKKWGPGTTPQPVTVEVFYQLPGDAQATIIATEELKEENQWQVVIEDIPTEIRGISLAPYLKVRELNPSADPTQIQQGEVKTKICNITPYRQEGYNRLAGRYGKLDEIKYAQYTPFEIQYTLEIEVEPEGDPQEIKRTQVYDDAEKDAPLGFMGRFGYGHHMVHPLATFENIQLDQDKLPVRYYQQVMPDGSERPFPDNLENYVLKLRKEEGQWVLYVPYVLLDGSLNLPAIRILEDEAPTDQWQEGFVPVTEKYTAFSALIQTEHPEESILLEGYCPPCWWLQGRQKTTEPAAPLPAALTKQPANAQEAARLLPKTAAAERANLFP